MPWGSYISFFSYAGENTISALGRLVLIIWLFVVLIINSSYTANFTSILIVQQLSSSIKGIQSLIESNDPIGYQENAQNYLHDDLSIPESRLVAFRSEAKYAEALRKDSSLSEDMSTAILKLSENGNLQRIHDQWLMRSACSSQETKLTVDRLDLKSFSGLFLICAIACFLTFVVYLGLMVRQFMSHCPSEEAEGGDPTPWSSQLQTFLSFADEKQKAVKSQSKKRQPKKASTGSGTLWYAPERTIDCSLNGSRISHMELSPSQRDDCYNEVLFQVTTHGPNSRNNYTDNTRQQAEHNEDPTPGLEERRILRGDRFHYLGMNS
ncbi:hypothetical protein Cgig2_009811 [Carnegiea gigantea]|uniref:Ionotropic glutamate receptor C-terminal domain-containing protein n=1 Tax=Carnegiea gigantea TaxID=171969 RepID=A0A9Q1Q4Z2_9CARY|nr:hypothetical protein Cgig2_009811 [Carnegiea gigantea]